MDRSWLASVLPSPTDTRSSRLSNGSKSPTPRWYASPSTRASPSVVPPPIFSSILLSDDRKSRHPSRQRTAGYIDTRVQSRQQQLERDLNRLLDLQGQCLNWNAADARATSIPHPQHDLAQIRKALYTTIRRLVLLKSDELALVRPDLEQCALTRDRLDDLTVRRDRLQLASADQDQQSRHGDDDVRALRQEADSMQSAIVEAEQRVAELKATQRRLRDEAMQIEDRVQARLDSNARSLQILDTEMAELLAPYGHGENDPRSGKHKTNQSDHAAVEEAKSRLQRELTSLRRQHEDADRYHEALEQSAIVWRDVAKDVSRFEAMLMSDMDTHAMQAETSSRHPEDAQQGMRTTLQHLEQLITQLESKHKLAQASDWKIVVSSIGAELDALRKGKLVLHKALASASGRDGVEHDETDGDDEEQRRQLERDDEHEHNSPEADATDRMDHGQRIRDLDGAFSSAKPFSASEPGTDDDDGPDPNLLMISQQESDHDD